jgi:hypothetical protein
MKLPATGLAPETFMRVRREHHDDAGKEAVEVCHGCGWSVARRDRRRLESYIDGMGSMFKLASFRFGSRDRQGDRWKYPLLAGRLLFLLGGLAGISSASAQAPKVAYSCMVREPAQHSPLMVVAPDDRKESLEARGFALVPCNLPAIDFRKYSAVVCKYAQEASLSEKALFQAKRKVTLDELCSFATSLSEP